MSAYILIYVLFWQPREVWFPSQEACEQARQIVRDELGAGRTACVPWRAEVER